MWKNKKVWMIALGIALVLVLGGLGVWQYERTNVPAFPINAADTISSWTFKGAYTGNDTLITKARTDITNLESMMGKGQYDDYDLNIGIANDYNLMGEGKSAYAYYNRAVKVHPAKGLAYADLGHLFDELAAYHTAADAYAKAVAVEPGEIEYHIERLNFLTTRFPDDQPRILAAFTDAANQFGDIAQVVAIEAKWLEDRGRYADAVTAWQRVKLLLPGRDTSAIDAQIARDKAKE